MSGFLVTGGAGFVGSHITEYLLDRGHQVTVLDCLTYAGALENLSHLPSKNMRIVHQDLGERFELPLGIEFVIHNAAESHVLRSLQDPEMFVRSNVIGTLNVLEAIRNSQSVRKLVYVSTDEVFGPASLKAHVEGDVLRPTNPYSATKAAGEYLVNSYRRSFGVPAVITRTTNMFGERQHSEKFVPLVIRHILEDKRLDIHAENGVIGSRCWLYAGEQARGLVYLAEHGVQGQVYHISAGLHFTNLELATMIADCLGKKLDWQLKEYLWPGHDLHYSMRGSAQSSCWHSGGSFTDQLKQTVLWYRDHPERLS